jgi:maleylacetoacetate isomerase
MASSFQPLRLFGYGRSSAAYRVRIALNLKSLPYESVSVHLLEREQHSSRYATLNPHKLVPLLQTGDCLISQSLAIIEYLDETYPEPPLLPGDRGLRAKVRAFALSIACEIHPLNNLRVLQHLTGSMSLPDATKAAWYQHWIREGLAPLEQIVFTSRDAGPFCFGNSPTIADLCLVPQLANARRTHCDLTQYPTLLGIEEHCLSLEAFRKAAPENQLPA